MEFDSFLARPAIQGFLFRFFMIFAASQLFLEFVSIIPIQQLLTQLVGGLLYLPVNGIYLPLSSIAVFEVTAFCTGLTSAAMLLGLLFGFAFPPLPQKIKLAVAGILLIFLVNVFRVAFVVYVGVQTQDVGLVEALHTLTWFIMSGLVLGMWYWGMKRITKTTNGNALARKLLNEK